jgi:hypothetical protein
MSAPTMHSLYMTKQMRKSVGARSRPYGKCGSIVHTNLMTSFVWQLVCGHALSLEKNVFITHTQVNHVNKKKKKEDYSTTVPKWRTYDFFSTWFSFKLFLY